VYNNCFVPVDDSALISCEYLGKNHFKKILFSPIIFFTVGFSLPPLFGGFLDHT
jgi:hypothetical protein